MTFFPVKLQHLNVIFPVKLFYCKEMFFIFKLLIKCCLTIHENHLYIYLLCVFCVTMPSLRDPPPSDLCSNDIVCLTFTEIRTRYRCKQPLMYKKEETKRTRSFRQKTTERSNRGVNCTIHKVRIISFCHHFTLYLTFTNKKHQIKVSP